MWSSKEQEHVANLIKRLENIGTDSTSVDKAPPRTSTEAQQRPDNWQPLAWMMYTELGAPTETPKVQLIGPS
eukprot:46390-Rhodomonas_salina.1